MCNLIPNANSKSFEHNLFTNIPESPYLVDFYVSPYVTRAKTKFRKLQATIKKDINDKLSNDMIGSLNTSGEKYLSHINALKHTHTCIHTVQ